MPVRIVNESGRTPVVLTCEHGGREVPRSLGDLGIAPAEMDRHIAYDIGAAELALAISERLDAPLVLQSYSRLVIDCNRPLHAPDCIPHVSDGTHIPANHDLTQADRGARYDAIHEPFHDVVADLIDRRGAGAAMLLAVHSFTPVLAGAPRRCHAGLLFNRDPRASHLMMAALEAAETGLTIAFNEPYSVDDLTDYTIPFHGERRGIPHGLVEIRNDQLADADGHHRWADLIANAVSHAVANLFSDKDGLP